MKWFRHQSSLVDLHSFIWIISCDNSNDICLSRDSNDRIFLHYDSAYERDEAYEEICNLLTDDDFFSNPYQNN